MISSERRDQKPNFSSTRELALETLGLAARLPGVTGAAVEVSEDRGIDVAVRLGELESVESSEEKVLTVSVWRGARTASASTSNLNDSCIEETVRFASDMAQWAAEDPASGLPDERDLQDTFRDLSLCHPWEGTVEDAAELLTRTEKAAFDADPRVVNSEGARFSASQGEFTLANTLGFCAGYRYGRMSLDCLPIVEDEHGMERGGWYSESRRFEGLMGPECLGRKAAGRGLARLGARNLSACTVPVLLEAPAAAGLLGMLEGLLTGRALYRHASCLEGKMGERLFPEHLSVRENPYEVGAIGSGVFDDEGCRGLERAVVDAGVLTGYFLASYSARKLGLTTTGNAGGAYNLALTSTRTRPEDDFDAMVKMLHRGLLLTEFMGEGLNPVTGECSWGVSGFWVEGGQIAYPVENVTAAGNILEIFRGIEAVGSDAQRFGSCETGSLLIDRMTLAG